MPYYPRDHRNRPVIVGYTPGYYQVEDKRVAELETRVADLENKFAALETKPNLAIRAWQTFRDLAGSMKVPFGFGFGVEKSKVEPERE